jgi:4a-hydroxytetrahydrobiopterin dehydratase
MSARPKRLSEQEIADRLASLPGWARVGDAITRTFTFAGFPEATAFVSRLVGPAEGMEHHPDLDVRYNRVIVTLSTHDQGGLTAHDFDLAALIDGAVAA